MAQELIGEKIRKLREENRMPLRKLAAILDIDQRTLSKLERGEKPLSRQMIPLIAKTFDKDEKELTIKFKVRQLLRNFKMKSLQLKYLKQPKRN
jgi:transcriptional regulator with XRE-family HTH domain